MGRVRTRPCEINQRKLRRHVNTDQPISSTSFPWTWPSQSRILPIAVTKVFFKIAFDLQRSLCVTGGVLVNVFPQHNLNFAYLRSVESFDAISHYIVFEGLRTPPPPPSPQEVGGICGGKGFQLLPFLQTMLLYLTGFLKELLSHPSVIFEVSRDHENDAK